MNLVKLGNILSPVPDVQPGTATVVPADAPARFLRRGPDSSPIFDIEIPRGLPGVNAIENDEAVAQYIGATDSATNTALKEAVSTPASPVAAAVKESLKGAYQHPRAATLVALGDSLTEQGGLVDPALSVMWSRATSAKAPWSWALVLTNQRFKFLKNRGVAGQTTDQILARVPAVIADAPEYCHVLAGTNDLPSVPAATIIANLASIYDALTGAGIHIIAGTIYPRTGIDKARLATVNQWIREQGQTRRGFTVVDYYACLSESTGEMPPAYTTDGIHLTNSGGKAVGLALAQAINSLIPPRPPAMPALGDPRNQLGATARMDTVPVASPAAGGWGFQQAAPAAPTFEVVDRTDGRPGKRLKVTIAAGGRAFLFVNKTAPTVGMTYQASAAVEVQNWETGAPANGRFVTMYAQQYDGSGFPEADKARALWYDNLTTFGSDLNLPWSGVLLTPKHVIQPYCSILQLVIELRGGGTYFISDPSLTVEAA